MFSPFIVIGGISKWPSEVGGAPPRCHGEEEGEVCCLAVDQFAAASDGDSACDRAY
jgi:hypothetical protein